MGPNGSAEGLLWVICSVPVADYKELGVLPPNSVIRVLGEIAKADTMQVELVNPRLQFIDKGRST